MKLSAYSLVLTLAIAAPSVASSEESTRFPSHCKPDELAYINARMAKTIYYPTKYELVKTGKILSICTDKESEPFSKIAYRYGKVGEVELEEIATKDNRFKVYSIQESPVGNNILFFNKGAFTYYVSEATNQGHGVSLIVYKSGKKIVDLFSGNEFGSDYESGMTGIDFENPSSPLLKRQKPKHVVW